MLLERPLQHINKKGRPVSQCPHCRGLRKSRSSHVKCECGDKPSDKYDARGTETQKDSIVGCADSVSGEAHSCACMTGQRCSCALKKEYLESVPENPAPNRPRSRANTDTRKPRLSTTYSDPSVTHFANGHHKPVHRHNHAGQECAPYKIPRPHSIHGPSSLSLHPYEDSSVNQTSDTYPSFFTDKWANIQQDDQRLVRSAHGSPGLNAFSKFEQFNSVPSLDLSYPAYNTSLTSSPAAEDYNQSYQKFDTYTSTPEDQPPLSAPLSGPSYAWSALDLPLDGGAFTSTSSQPPSYASLDQSHLSRPGLTTASSADASEIGDYAIPHNGVPSPGFAEGSPYVPSPAENNSSNGIASNTAYNLSTDSFPIDAATTGGSVAAAVSMALGANNSSFETSSVESFIPSHHSASPFDPTDLSIKPPNSESFTHHGLTVQDAQKMAHPSIAGGSSIDIVPTGNTSLNSAPTSDPLWAATFAGGEDEEGFAPGSASASQAAFRGAGWMS